jgi:hypothetical protein
MNVTFEPIARDACDHRHAEDRYLPSRKLKHLLHARSRGGQRLEQQVGDPISLG